MPDSTKAIPANLPPPPDCFIQETALGKLWETIIIVFLRTLSAIHTMKKLPISCIKFFLGRQDKVSSIGSSAQDRGVPF